jgi:hypothetical protein
MIKWRVLFILAVAIDCALAQECGAGKVPLGTAGDYVVLAKSGITNVPTSDITGDLGISPAAATFITGLSLSADATNVFSRAAQVTGKLYASNYALPTPSNLGTAIGDMERAYNDAAGRATSDASKLNLGGSSGIAGMTLTPGTYTWTVDIYWATDIFLRGNRCDVFIMQTSKNLIAANAARVVLLGGVQAANVFWQVAGNVRIGTTAHMEGSIISKTDVTFETGSSLNGLILSQTLVALQKNTIVKSTFVNYETVKTFSPTVNTSSPTVRTSSPTVRTSSPTLRTSSPTVRTSAPTKMPTTAQPTTKQPTKKPTALPTKLPTKKPTTAPTKLPTAAPTKKPTMTPTKAGDTFAPTKSPTTKQPTTAQPTGAPTTVQPTRAPTSSPTRKPTTNPTAAPTTLQPTGAPTKQPTLDPTKQPTLQPTRDPTKAGETFAPTITTKRPTQDPTKQPTKQPTALPTKIPTKAPTKAPSAAPTPAPSKELTPAPTVAPVGETTVKMLAVKFLTCLVLNSSGTAQLNNETRQAFANATGISVEDVIVTELSCTNSTDSGRRLLQSGLIGLDISVRSTGFAKAGVSSDVALTSDDFVNIKKVVTERVQKETGTTVTLTVVERTR